MSSRGLLQFDFSFCKGFIKKLDFIKLDKFNLSKRIPFHAEKNLISAPKGFTMLLPKSMGIFASTIATSTQKRLDPFFIGILKTGLKGQLEGVWSAHLT